MKKVNYIPVLFILLLFVNCNDLKIVNKTEMHMGTTVNIKVYHEESQYANKAVDLAFEEVKRLDGILSSYKEDSEVSQLNRKGFIENASKELLENIDKAIYYGELSNGAFDITVKPVLDLYTKAFNEWDRAPSDGEIKDVLPLVNYKKIKINGKTIILGQGQMITLGGIAKGYVIDRAIEVLKKNGITHGLVEAGGDIQTIGQKVAGIDWTIALVNPRNTNEFITRMHCSDYSIVTSGDYERYYDEDKKYHHIIHPQTGYSATELISVTIIAKNAFDADALSTTVFVMGKESGLELINALPGVEGLLITADRDIIRSDHFSDFEVKDH